MWLPWYSDRWSIPFSLHVSRPWNVYKYQSASSFNSFFPKFLFPEGELAIFIFNHDYLLKFHFYWANFAKNWFKNLKIKFSVSFFFFFWEKNFEKNFFSHRFTFSHLIRENHFFWKLSKAAFILKCQHFQISLLLSGILPRMHVEKCDVVCIPKWWISRMWAFSGIY